MKVIYLGLPMRLDESTEPPTLRGFWAWVPGVWFNGHFMAYEGSYLRALWQWLRGAS